MTTEAQTTERKITFIPTAEKVTVTDYPYGRLRCTLYDTMEFDFKKGYRHVTQTINPKTNRINNPKKSTYSDFLIRYYDEKNHIKVLYFSFNGDKEFNKGVKFLHEHFNLFSEREISALYTLCFGMLKLSMRGSVVYNGAKMEDLVPYYDDIVKKMVEGMKNPTQNLFDVQLDIAGIKSVEIEGYQPFRVSKAVNIMDL